MITDVRYALACRDATNQAAEVPSFLKLRALLVSTRQAKAYRALGKAVLLKPSIKRAATEAEGFGSTVRVSFKSCQGFLD